MYRRSLVHVGLMLLLTTVSLAPASAEPEQISALQLDWNGPAQEFDIRLAVKRSLIAPSPGCSSCAARDVRINVTIEVAVDDAILVLSEPDYPMPSPRSDPAVPVQGFVEVAPIRIPWDRDGGRIAGEAPVTVELELVRSDGVPIPGATAHKTALLIFL